MIYCLDTNAIILSLKAPTGEPFRRRIAEATPEQIRIPEMVRAELLYGVAKSVRAEENRKRVEAFLAPFRYLPFGGEAVEHFADIRAGLERKGEVIGPYDLVISATVRAFGGTLVTNNVSEFSRVDGLRVEDWLTPRR